MQCKLILFPCQENNPFQSFLSFCEDELAEFQLSMSKLSDTLRLIYVLLVGGLVWYWKRARGQKDKDCVLILFSRIWFGIGGGVGAFTSKGQKDCPDCQV